MFLLRVVLLDLSSLYLFITKIELLLLFHLIALPQREQRNIFESYLFSPRKEVDLSCSLFGASTQGYWKCRKVWYIFLLTFESTVQEGSSEMENFFLVKKITPCSQDASFTANLASWISIFQHQRHTKNVIGYRHIRQ